MGAGHSHHQAGAAFRTTGTLAAVVEGPVGREGRKSGHIARLLGVSRCRRGSVCGFCRGFWSALCQPNEPLPSPKWDLITQKAPSITLSLMVSPMCTCDAPHSEPPPKPKTQQDKKRSNTLKPSSPKGLDSQALKPCKKQGLGFRV